MSDLIGNNYEQTEDQLNAKKWMKIIGIILVILLIVCIGLIVFIYYYDSIQLKVTIDGKENTTLQDIVIIDGDEIYLPIRQFASYVGYESYSGEYKQYAEDETKCYVQCSNEVASFTMDSDKIYKLETDESDYEYFTINEPIKMIDGVLYITMEGAEEAFNIQFNYNQDKNTITIYTLPYLVTYWSSKITNSAISGDDENFSNQKALLYNRIIVKNSEGYYGVYDLSKNEILGTKYASIEFVESSQEFIVTTAEKKMGIMSYDASTKISPEYDDIKQIDKDAGLYLVTNNSKQGVINNSGSIVVYLEYDQIGIDASLYSTNNIKNQYLLYDNCIPVKKDNKWGIYDKTGKQILAVEYDGLGCTAGTGSSSSKTSTNNILLIEDYEGIVVKKDDLYGIIDSDGDELIPIALTSVYSTTSAGEETYYMIYNGQVMNVIDYIKTYVKNETATSTSGTETSTNTTNTVEETEDDTTDSDAEETEEQTDNTGTEGAVPTGSTVDETTGTTSSETTNSTSNTTSSASNVQSNTALTVEIP